MYYSCLSHAQLINYYVKEKYTLRYTGGMVPDVNQVLRNVFSQIDSNSYKKKKKKALMNLVL